MMPITTTTVFPMNPISFQRWPSDISMTKFPPRRPAAFRRAHPLIQFEVDGEIENDVDRLPVERAGAELPPPDRVRRSLIETERQRLEDLHVRDVSVLVDDAFDDDDAGDPRLARHFRV